MSVQSQSPHGCPAARRRRAREGRVLRRLEVSRKTQDAPAIASAMANLSRRLLYAIGERQERIELGTQACELLGSLGAPNAAKLCAEVASWQMGLVPHCRLHGPAARNQPVGQQLPGNPQPTGIRPCSPRSAARGRRATTHPGALRHSARQEILFRAPGLAFPDRLTLGIYYDRHGHT